MSDTPRTDAVDAKCNELELKDAVFYAIFHFGELERELNRACEMYRKLDIHTLNLVDRIRRLEEAGDKMEPWCSDWAAASNWEKAKEAKL